ncbi:MAG: 3-hydroxyacyl-CoA dehydrogenase [Burkholderiales bacterium]|nr:3-hydroxyacyl-CoA dehydrogenase [Burkholderiales bacterium]
MKAARQETAAIIGGGKMGADIAAVLAAGGWSVHVQEPDAAMRASLPQRARTALDYLRAGRAGPKRIRIHETLDTLPWPQVAFVIEAVPEQLALKQALFRRLEALALREAILATNTSSLRLSAIMSGVKRKDRVALVHFATPAYVAPLVEIVRGARTSDATIRRVNAWLRELGKITVNLRRDVPGMIVNRAQHAMMRECFDLVDKGIASLEDIDRAVRYGFGFRYVACGPVRQRDLNSLLINYRAACQIYPTLNSSPRVPRALSSRVRAGQVGVTVGHGFYSWGKGEYAPWLERYERTLAKVLELMRAFDAPARAPAAPKKRARR